jgi:hypothetical protein
MESLHIKYAQYLSGARSKPEMATISRLLVSHGFERHGTFLSRFAEFGPFVDLTNPLTGKKQSVGSSPPLDAEIGDGWFDVIELMPHIFIEDSSGENSFWPGWYPLHPVTKWQYLGFLMNFDYEFKRIPRNSSRETPDLFSILRLKKQVEEASIVDIYYFEASSYASWFGKGLVGENIIAVEVLNNEELKSSMAPKNLNLWSNMGYRREDDPLAFNLQTAKYEDYDDLEFLKTSEENKVIYSEWERNIHTGFACFMPAKGPLLLPHGEVYPYIQSSNPISRG